MEEKPKYEYCFERWVDELMRLSVGGKVIKKKDENLKEFEKIAVGLFEGQLNKLFYIGKIPFLAKNINFKSVEIERYAKEFDSSKYEDKKRWKSSKEQNSRVRKLLVDRGYKKWEDYD
jgi:hypothetical protein